MFGNAVEPCKDGIDHAQGVVCILFDRVHRAIAELFKRREHPLRRRLLGILRAVDANPDRDAKYGEKIRVQTGRYTETASTVTLKDVDRSYDLTFSGDTVVFTDPVTGKAMTLDRFN